MDKMEVKFEGLNVPEGFFKGVRFYLTGKVPEKVGDLLKQGGAMRMNYFSDYVTHLICGEEAEDTDLCDANDIYEIPAVEISWILHSIKLNRLLDTKPFTYVRDKLFANLVFSISGLKSDRNTLASIVNYYGGVFQLNLDENCTHLITVDVSNEKYLTAEGKMNIITPDWILECVKSKKLVECRGYHPKLLNWPKKGESTTAITGFEPEELESNNKVSDSTQALLEKLKQRLPWNVPQSTTSGDIIPPNVVAPSYASTKLPQPQELNQSKLISNQNYSQKFIPSFDQQLFEKFIQDSIFNKTQRTTMELFLAISGPQQQARSQIQQSQEILMPSSNNQAFLSQDEKEIADETKRVGGEAKYLDEEPEMAGSFKKLDVS